MAERPEDLLNRLIAALYFLEKKMTALDDSIAANTAAVTDNTTQVNALIAKLSDPNSEPTQAQLDALAANTTALTANNTAAANALNPPAAEPAAPAEGALTAEGRAPIAGPRSRPPRCPRANSLRHHPAERFYLRSVVCRARCCASRPASAGIRCRTSADARTEGGRASRASCGSGARHGRSGVCGGAVRGKGLVERLAKLLGERARGTEIA